MPFKESNTTQERMSLGFTSLSNLQWKITCNTTPPEVTYTQPKENKCTVKEDLNEDTKVWD